MAKKRRVFRIAIGRRKLDGRFGITDRFVNVLAVSRAAAEQQVRKDAVKKAENGDIILFDERYG